MIDEKQKMIVRAFMLRPPMYLGADPDRENVTLFIHGMECMVEHNVCLTKHMNELLMDKYKTYGGSFGWPNAVERFATKNKLTWFEAFSKLCNELFEE